MRERQAPETTYQPFSLIYTFSLLFLVWNYWAQREQPTDNGHG
jgi:hypothetical protein